MQPLIVPRNLLSLIKRKDIIMDYISIKEAALKWDVSDRMVRKYCTDGKVKGARYENKTWYIPSSITKPAGKSKAHNPVHKEVVLTTLSKRLQYEQSKNNHYGIYEYLQVNLTYSSNRLASNRLTREQVTELFRTNKVSVSFEPMKVDDVIETINHFDCTKMIIDKVTAPLSQDFIKKLHRALYYGTYADRKNKVRLGIYRNMPHKWGVSPVIIRNELSSLITKYENNPAVSLEAILDFHARFEKIRPFDDGNGRVGRLLLVKECLRFGIDPFIIEDKRRAEYYKGISMWKSDPSILLSVSVAAQERFQHQRELCRLMQYCRAPLYPIQK